MPREIIIDDVSKSFGDTRALAGISLTIDPSEIVCVLGPSGCGKTTLLDLIAGFDLPESGTILVNQHQVTKPSPERGVVFQAPSLLPWVTVRKNIVLGMNGVDRSAVEEMIHAVGLSGFADKYPYQLSGGMKQRAVIARALIRSPEILLMDEPFGALDAQTRLEMQELLQTIWEAYKPTILFITHDVEEAVFVGDRIIVLAPRPGRIRMEVMVPFARPRDYSMLSNTDFVATKQQVLEVMHELRTPQLGEIA